MNEEKKPPRTAMRAQTLLTHHPTFDTMPLEYLSDLVDLLLLLPRIRKHRPLATRQYFPQFSVAADLLCSSGESAPTQINVRASVEVCAVVAFRFRPTLRRTCSIIIVMRMILISGCAYQDQVVGTILKIPVSSRVKPHDLKNS